MRAPSDKTVKQRICVNLLGPFILIFKAPITLAADRSLDYVLFIFKENKTKLFKVTPLLDRCSRETSSIIFFER